MVSVRKSVVAALLLLGISIGAVAETTNFECSYTTYSDKGGSRSLDWLFRLTFLIDAKTEKGYRYGVNGLMEAELVPNSDGFTFVETTLAGDVLITAIAKNGDSVHSRNEIVGGVIVIAQYHGKCAKK